MNLFGLLVFMRDLNFKFIRNLSEIYSLYLTCNECREKSMA